MTHCALPRGTWRGFRVASSISVQQFDRNLPFQDEVHGPPHAASATRAERLVQAVSARQRHARANHGIPNHRIHGGQHRRRQGDNSPRHVRAGGSGASGQT